MCTSSSRIWTYGTHRYWGTVHTNTADWINYWLNYFLRTGWDCSSTFLSSERSLMSGVPTIDSSWLRRKNTLLYRRNTPYISSKVVISPMEALQGPRVVLSTSRHSTKDLERSKETCNERSTWYCQIQFSDLSIHPWGALTLVFCWIAWSNGRHCCSKLAFSFLSFSFVLENSSKEMQF